MKDKDILHICHIISNYRASLGDETIDYLCFEKEERTFLQVDKMFNLS